MGPLRYGATATYECPEGFVFELGQEESRKKNRTLELRCGPLGLWEPRVQPKCVRESLRNFLSYFVH